MHRFLKVFTLSAFTSLLVFFGVACSSTPSTPEGTVAATVNGKKITLAEVETIINQQLQGQQSKLGPVQLAQVRLQALDGLIRKEVLVQRAERENLKPTEDEIRQYISAKKQEGGLTEEQFQRTLKQQNQTEEGLREEARKLLAIQKLQAKYAGSVNISDREVEEYYLSNRQAFTLGRGVELAVIVADPRDNGLTDDAKTDSDAKAKIDGLYQQLKAGSTDFAELSRARSEDQNRERGGDIGFATEDDLRQNGFPAPLIARFFGPMQVGDYSEPVEFNGKWYIFKLKRKQLVTENRTLESPNVRQEITEILRGQHQQILNEALVEVALREAKIVNNLAADLLNNPNNLGLRPAASGTPTPAATSTTSTSPSPSAPATTPPATRASPGK